MQKSLKTGIFLPLSNLWDRHPPGHAVMAPANAFIGCPCLYRKRAGVQIGGGSIGSVQAPLQRQKGAWDEQNAHGRLAQPCMPKQACWGGILGRGVLLHPKGVWWSKTPPLPLPSSATPLHTCSASTQTWMQLGWDLPLSHKLSNLPIGKKRLKTTGDMNLFTDTVLSWKDEWGKRMKLYSCWGNILMCWV